MHATLKVEKTEHEGWRSCYRVSNGEVELIITGDVGQRVIRFRFVGGQNVFKEYADQVGKTGEEKFFNCEVAAVSGKLPKILSPLGHRTMFPSSYTDRYRSYRPCASRASVLASERDRSEYGPDGQISSNCKPSLYALEFALWALTMMAPGGVAISPFFNGSDAEELRASEAAGRGMAGDAAIRIVSR